MNLSASPHQTHRPPVKRPAVPPPVTTVGKWYLPLMATIAIGFGVANYYTSHKQNYYYQAQEEEERLRRNQEIMDSYGDKENVQDLQRALEAYEIQ